MSNSRNNNKEKVLLDKTFQALRDGNVEKAQEYIGRFSHPNFDVQYSMGRIFQANGNWKDAEKIFNGLLKIAKDENEFTNAYIALHYLFRQNHQSYDKAEKCLLLAPNQDSAKILLTWLSFYQRTHRPVKPQEKIIKLQELNKAGLLTQKEVKELNRFKTLLNTIWTYEGEFKLVDTEFKGECRPKVIGASCHRLIENLPPLDSEDRSSRAQETREIIEKFKKHFPTLPEGYYLSANLYAAIYKHEKAVAEYEFLLENYPTFWRGLIGYGLYISKQNQDEKKSNRIFEGIIKYDPENLANIDGISPLLECPPTNSQLSTAYVSMSINFKQMQQYEAAKQYLHFAEMKDPNNPSIFTTRAKLNETNERIVKMDGVFVNYQKSKELSPERFEKKHPLPVNLASNVTIKVHPHKELNGVSLDNDRTTKNMISKNQSSLTEAHFFHRGTFKLPAETTEKLQSGGFTIYKKYK